MELMEAEDYVQLSKTFGPKCSAFPTALGRMLLREPDYLQQERVPQITINIVEAIDSYIGTLAQAGHDARIRQPRDEKLHDRIVKILDQMVAEVLESDDNIEPDVRHDYQLEAEGLKTELKKSRLNLQRIREMIAFLLEFGQTKQSEPCLVRLEAPKNE